MSEQEQQNRRRWAGTMQERLQALNRLAIQSQGMSGDVLAGTMGEVLYRLMVEVKEEAERRGWDPKAGGGGR